MRRLSDQEALRVWLRGLGLATLAHVMLFDYEQPGWEIPRAIGLLGGALLLCVPHPPPTSLHQDRRSFWGWCCLILAIAKLFTLLGARDVLTQSLLLTTLYIVGAWGLWRPQAARESLIAATWCVSLTYGLAILHKLNSDFLYTPESCAIHGVEISLSLLGQLDEWSSALNLSTVRGQLSFWAADNPTLCATGVISLELILAILCVSRSKWIWLWGYLFHIPLTLTIAPAFGSVMAAGWGAGSVLESSRSSSSWCRLRRGRPRRGRVKETSSLRASPIIWIPLLYGLHGLSPYFGVEVQHSAAMLSNLRVDPLCANSLVMPRLDHDPYIYIDAARFGDSSLPQRERVLRETLWNLAALHTMRRNWCIPERRPLSLRGSYGGQPFIIPDLCASGSLRHLDQGVFSPSGWQRFQKNLLRQCHQACVH